MSQQGRILRLAERERPEIRFHLDGQMVIALAGDTLLTAVLTAAHSLRRSEFGPEGRAGFCLMGACQDCWIWQEGGPRLRACSTMVADGMRLLTQEPEAWP